jgi:hypothetical protein
MFYWSMILSENRHPLFRIMLILLEHDLIGKPASTFPDHALPALSCAHDLDVVARPQLRVRPSSARNDGTVKRNCNAALPGIDRFSRKQRLERGRPKRLSLTIHSD